MHLVSDIYQFNASACYLFASQGVTVTDPVSECSCDVNVDTSKKILVCPFTDKEKSEICQLLNLVKKNKGMRHKSFLS